VARPARRRHRVLQARQRAVVEARRFSIEQGTPDSPDAEDIEQRTRRAALPSCTRRGRVRVSRDSGPVSDEPACPTPALDPDAPHRRHGDILQHAMVPVTCRPIVTLRRGRGYRRHRAAIGDPRQGAILVPAIVDEPLDRPCGVEVCVAARMRCLFQARCVRRFSHIPGCALRPGRC